MHTIIKHISDNLELDDKVDREGFVTAIKRVIGETDFEVIDSHNTSSIIFILRDKGQSQVVKAELGSDTATHREINWYKDTIGTYQESLYLDSIETPHYALLLLKHKEDAQTLDEWILDNPSKDHKFAQYVLKSVQYDEALHNQSRVIVSQEKAGDLVLGKYKNRRAESAKISYLDELLTRRQISINGKKCLTPDFAFKKITDSSLMTNHLTPKKLGTIHGDLHTGNILIQADRLYFIDPSGIPLLPIEYDLGKILQSVHGKYPHIMRGEFKVNKSGVSDYEFSIDHNSAYQTAHEYLKKHIAPDMYLRSLYTEALHFATMLSHHAGNREETTALYLSACKSFDELFLLL